jgi:hypothetical protein
VLASSSVDDGQRDAYRDRGNPQGGCANAGDQQDGSDEHEHDSDPE